MRLIVCAALVWAGAASAETWRGLTVSPEHRCSPYRAGDYSYPQSVEPLIVAQVGKVYGPYTGRCFASRSETDIEHMVARSEAHDSGLCAAAAETRSRFAQDLLNLTLAGPRVNRYQKRAYDAADWLPPENKCWFAARVVEVRRKYELTIDRREANALERVLSACTSTEMVVGECAPIAEPPARRLSESEGDPLELYDDNGNGRITCAEARRHGIAPVPRSHPAYRYMRDADGDGVVCE
ncbi:MAG: excalibur calcium-binding domain-containing protein [Gemmatimonadota bacterium]|nr:excalibur calcium-binding domain-containing protein [Gemmatimonadota bacterium]